MLHELSSAEAWSVSRERGSNNSNTNGNCSGRSRDDNNNDELWQTYGWHVIGAAIAEGAFACTDEDWQIVGESDEECTCTSEKASAKRPAVEEVVSSSEDEGLGTIGAGSAGPQLNAVRQDPNEDITVMHESRKAFRPRKAQEAEALMLGSAFVQKHKLLSEVPKAIDNRFARTYPALEGSLKLGKA